MPLGNREWKGNGLPVQLASRFAGQPKVWLAGATRCGRGNRCLRGGIGVPSGGAGRWFGLFGIAGSVVCEPMGGGKKGSHECFASTNPPTLPEQGGRTIARLESENGSDRARIGLARGDWYGRSGGSAINGEGYKSHECYALSLEGAIGNPLRDQRNAL